MAQLRITWLDGDYHANGDLERHFETVVPWCSGVLRFAPACRLLHVNAQVPSFTHALTHSPSLTCSCALARVLRWIDCAGISQLQRQSKIEILRTSITTDPSGRTLWPKRKLKLSHALRPANPCSLAAVFVVRPSAALLWSALAPSALGCRLDGNEPSLGFLHALGGFTYLYTCQDVAFPIHNSLRNNTTRRFAAVAGSMLKCPIKLTVLQLMWAPLNRRRSRSARSARLGIGRGASAVWPTWHGSYLHGAVARDGVLPRPCLQV